MSTIRSFIRKATEAGPKTRTTDTQATCRKCKDSTEKKATDQAKIIRDKLDTGLTTKELAPVLGVDWPEPIFRSTKETGSSILASKHLVRILILDPDDTRDKRPYDRMGAQFPALALTEEHLELGSTVKLRNAAHVLVDEIPITSEGDSFLIVRFVKPPGEVPNLCL